MSKIDKGEVIELDQIIAQTDLNKNVRDYMFEMKRDQAYTFQESSDSSDDNATNIDNALTTESQPEEEGDEGRLKVPKLKNIANRRTSMYS